MATKHRTLSYLGQLLVLAFVYLLAGKAGLLLAIPPGYATAIFPASGAALAGLLLGGYRLWPGVLLGSIALNSWVGWEARGEITFFSLMVAGGIGLGSSLQAAAGSFLVRRAVGFPTPLTNERDIFYFFGLAGPVSCVVGATVAVSVLTAAQAIPIADALYTWWTWWVGDIMGILVIIPIAFSFIGRPRNVWRRRRLAVSVPIVALLALIIVIFFRTSENEIERSSQEFRKQAVLHVRTFRNNMQTHLNSLIYLRSLFDNIEEIPQLQFKRFADDLLSIHFGAHAYSWNPMVLAKERLDYERNARLHVSSGLQIVERDENGRLVPAKIREEHVVVQFIEPLAKNKSATGFDVASNPVRKVALDVARDTGRPVATGRITLVQETQQQSGILVFVPVYFGENTPKSVLARREQLRGFVVGVFRVGDMLTAVMPEGDKKNLHVRVYDISSDIDGKVLLAKFGEDENIESSSESSSKTRSSDSAFLWTETFEFGGRKWRFDLAPTSGTQSGTRRMAAWVVLAGGLLFASLLGGFLLVITGRTFQIEELVKIKTSEAVDSAARTRAIVETVVDGIITIDRQGRIETANPAAERIFGYPEEEMLGQNVRMLMPEPYRSEHDQYLSRYLEGGEAKVIGHVREVAGQRKDGAIFPLDLAVSELAVGEQRLFTGVVRDISERKEVDRMKNEFIAIVSHELRTPLTSILGSLEMLSKGVVGELPVDARTLVEISFESSQRLVRLINDILDIEKLESGKRELRLQKFDISTLIEVAIESNRAYANNYGVKLCYKRPVSEIRTTADRDLITQVFTNLLSNAAKFSPENTQVEVSTLLIEGAVMVTVKDHGPGIPEKDRSKIFKKFSQVDSSDTRVKGGTGLGLAISKAIIEQHKGTIGFDSESDGGTTFYFTLPAVGVPSDADHVGENS